MDLVSLGFEASEGDAVQRAGVVLSAPAIEFVLHSGYRGFPSHLSRNFAVKTPSRCPQDLAFGPPDIVFGAQVGPHRLLLSLRPFELGE